MAQGDHFRGGGGSNAEIPHIFGSNVFYSKDLR